LHYHSKVKIHQDLFLKGYIYFSKNTFKTVKQLKTTVFYCDIFSNVVH